MKLIKKRAKCVKDPGPMITVREKMDFNICMVNALFHPYVGGTEKHMYELGQRIADEREIHVLTSLLEGTESRENVKGMEVHRFPAKLLEMPLIYPPPLVIAPGVRDSIKELDREYDFDIFNLHGRWFPDFASSVSYASKREKLSVLTLHNVRPLGINPLVSFLGSLYDYAYGIRVLRNVDRIIAVSEFGKADISKYGIKKEKIEVIHNGVDTDFFRPASATYREKYCEGFDNVLVFQGRIIKQKGIHHLINAMPQVLEEFPSTGLLIIGKGEMVPNLKKLAKENGVEENVVFTGFIPERDLPNAFSSADVFVLPSLWEVLPVSLLEALSCGTPLLASDAGGNPEVVEEKKNGFIFEKGNVEELAEKLILMLDDEKLREKMSDESRKIALSKFDWKNIVDETLEFYESAIEDFY